MDETVATAENYEGVSQLGVKRDTAAGSFFGDPIFKGDALTDLATRIQDHGPFELGDLCGPEACAVG
jgi:hypothetical protein